jgi:Tol biopolymer transport system component/DNA-binding winged helix-turn-helix (wHTH) protein
MPRPTPDEYQFGPYRLDADQRTLTRGNERVSLPPKTFDLLLLLVRSRGRALSKRELMSALWPETFVEEANLSFQISTLRKALGGAESAWIETVSKHGYRFAADVVTGDVPALVAAPSLADQASAGMVPAPERSRKHWILTVGLLAGLLIVAAGYVAFVSPRSSAPLRYVNAVATPLTAYPGSQTGPSLSPDGNQIAFSWDGPGRGNPRIYVKLVGMGEPIPLTSGAEHDESPSWSPDGQRIAFVRRRPGRAIEAYVMPALGGAEKRVASLFLDSSRRSTRLSWSPDGKSIVIGGKPSASEPFGLWLVEVDGKETRRLTTPPSREWIADVEPALSPDGRRLAFIRHKATSNAIFMLPLSPDKSPTGEPVQVVGDPRQSISGLAWTPDGRSLVYSLGGFLAPTRLEQLDLTPGSTPAGPPHRLTFGERAIRLSIASTGRLVYSALLRDANLWRLEVARPGSVPVDAGLPLSTLHEGSPSYCPNCNQVVFSSTRSGSDEIWISNVDGSNLRQMTSMGGPLCAGARWSPDGQSILFISTRDGTSDLYLLIPRTREIRRLTTDATEEIEANWSRDGRSIYFGSNRTGRFEIWRMPADGGAAVQVTKNGGQTAQESPDRRYLYYAKNGAPTTIWRLSLDSGEDVQIVDGLSYTVNFIVGERGIYFLAVGDTPTATSIDFFEFSTSKRTTVARVGKPWWSGIDLSPDQRWLLFATIDRDGSNLMVVDPIR